MFFDKEFEFIGRHATYCRFLKEGIGAFKTYKDIYAISAIIGFINGKRADRDTKKEDGKTVQPASILPGEMQNIRPRLAFVYRLMMLLEPIENGDLKMYQDRTFRDDADYEKHPERLKANLQLFNSYVLGGIEILYDMFKECKTKKDAVNVLSEYLFDFYEDNALLPE